LLSLQQSILASPSRDGASVGIRITAEALPEISRRGNRNATDIAAFALYERVQIMKLKPGKPTPAAKNTERRVKRAIDKISEQTKHRPDREEAEREVDDDLNEAGIKQHAKDVARAIDKNY
jgi:hypothetical protein